MGARDAYLDSTFLQSNFDGIGNFKLIDLKILVRSNIYDIVFLFTGNFELISAVNVSKII